MRDLKGHLLSGLAVLISGILLYLQLLQWKKAGDDYRLFVINAVVTVALWAFLGYCIYRFHEATDINSFNPLSISSKVWRLDLSAMNNSEPFIAFEIDLTNGCNKRITLNKVEGRILCNSELCTASPTLSKHHVIEKGQPSEMIRLVQPISQELANKTLARLKDDSTIVVFSFGGIYVLGEADAAGKLENIAIPLASSTCWIKGPVSLQDRQNLTPMERVFVNSAHEDQFGRKR